MPRIHTVSRYLLFLTHCLLILLPFLMIWQWFLPQWQPQFLIPPETYYAHLEIGEFNVEQWDFLSRCLGFLADVIGSLPLFFGLFILKKLLLNYQQGKIFSLYNARCYKYLGIALLMYAVLAKPLEEVLLSVAASLTSPDKMLTLGITFTNTNITALISSLFVLVISWVMVEASQLHDDQSLTI